jgi:diacylglycerol O-acyltransferase / wax synthase
MNITLSTYDQNVDFGIIACRRSMPQVQRVIDYMEEALVDLEDAAGIATPAKKARVPAKRKAKAKAKAKAKTKTKVKAKTKTKVKVKAKTKAKAKPKAKAKARPKSRSK